jgi:hypothetical protein
MSIEHLLQQRVFDPEIMSVMTAAYEGARAMLGLTSRTDPATELLAQTVIGIVEGGVCDSEQVLAQTLAAFRRGGDPV